MDEALVGQWVIRVTYHDPLAMLVYAHLTCVRMLFNAYIQVCVYSLCIYVVVVTWASVHCLICAHDARRRVCTY